MGSGSYWDEKMSEDLILFSLFELHNIEEGSPWPRSVSLTRKRTHSISLKGRGHPLLPITTNYYFYYSEFLEKAQDQGCRFLGLLHLDPMPRSFYDFNKAQIIKRLGEGGAPVGVEEEHVV